MKTKFKSWCVSLGDYFFKEFAEMAKTMDKRTIADINRKIIRKKKLKVGETEYNLEDWAKDSVENSVISRIDALTNDSTLDGNGKTLIKFHNLSNEAAIYKSIGGDHAPLLVEIINKKKVSDFNAIQEGMIDTLGRCSNFPMVWNSIKDRWNGIVGEMKETADTYVLYVPGIRIYLDAKGTLKVPREVNVLLVAVASAKYMDTEGTDKLSRQAVCNNIVSDTLKAMTYIGKHPIVLVEPIAYKYLAKLPIQPTMVAWKRGTENPSFNNTIRELHFILHSETDVKAAHSLFE